MSVCFMVQDAEYWHGVAASELSDTYKDAFGVRPRHYDFKRMTTLEIVHETQSLEPHMYLALGETSDWLERERINAEVQERWAADHDGEHAPLDEFHKELVPYDFDDKGNRVWTF